MSCVNLVVDLTLADCHTWYSSTRTFTSFCLWWPAAPGRGPEHPPSPDGRWLGTANFCYSETNRRFFKIISIGPAIPQKVQEEYIKKTEKNHVLCAPLRDCSLKS